MSGRPFYFATHCEMQDAAATAEDLDLAPAAATVELASLLSRFETQIDDDTRATIIRIGGALLRLGDRLASSGSELS